jgi:hypothetical protein
MNGSMIDRPKALLGGVAVLAAIVLIAIGFIAGRASNTDGDSDPREAPTAGPTDLQGGVPVGFAHSQDGARAAAAAWFPWLYSSPIGERPEGIDGVLAPDVEAPGQGGSDRLAAVRLQFAPLGVRVEMDASDRATVRFLGSLLAGDPGEPLSGELLIIPITMEWDETAGDWRITELPTGPWDDYDVGDGLDAAEVAGFEAIRPTGVVEGSPIVEEVPGE